MKTRHILLLCACSSISAPSWALPPVVNSGSGYPAPAPNTAPVPKPPAANTLYEVMSRLEQLQSEVQQLTGKVEEQAYLNAELKKRLSTMYADFDERMQSVESKLDGGNQPAGDNPSVQENGDTDQPAADKPAEQENSDANEPEARNPPESTGSAGSEGSNETQPAVQQNQPVPAPAEAEAAPASAEEKQEYQQAYDALRNGRTAQSIEAFNAFLGNYPSGQYANNAQYWLGEAHRVNQDADSARKAFNKLMESYPNSPKVPDAVLKLGYIEFDLKNWAKAREYLTRVTHDFPNTSAARLASKKLSQIQDVSP